MGCNFLKRTCSSSPYAIASSNPNPAIFTIEHEYTIGEYLILRVRYPGCTNFEGVKLMVYLGYASSKELLRATQGKLDPHFQYDETAPFARFAPTDLSYRRIEKLCAS